MSLCLITLYPRKNPCIRHGAGLTWVQMKSAVLSVTALFGSNRKLCGTSNGTGKKRNYNDNGGSVLSRQPLGVYTLVVSADTPWLKNKSKICRDRDMVTPPRFSQRPLQPTKILDKSLNGWNVMCKQCNANLLSNGTIAKESCNAEFIYVALHQITPLEVAIHSSKMQPSIICISQLQPGRLATLVPKFTAFLISLGGPLRYRLGYK